MPYFAITCLDKPDALETRMANREAHLAYVAETGNVVIGGPFLDEGKMYGSFLILDAPDRAAAEEWCEADPYARAGLFAEVTIREWKRVIG